MGQRGALFLKVECEPINIENKDGIRKSSMDAKIDGLMFYEVHNICSLKLSPHKLLIIENSNLSEDT